MEENANQTAEIKIKKGSNKALILTGIFIVVLIAALFTNGFGLFTGSAVSNPALEIGNSPVLGEANAPVTIYIFSDFSCQYCAAADGKNEQAIAYLRQVDPSWEAPIPKIIDEYVNIGKVKLVFKFYPGHDTGRAAHIVGYALIEQNLFWQFHDLAFADQANTRNLDKMKVLAAGLGADMAKLNEFISNKTYESYFNSDIALGKAVGITGTPTFFINNEKIEGALPFSEFQKAIDKILK